MKNALLAIQANTILRTIILSAMLISGALLFAPEVGFTQVDSVRDGVEVTGDADPAQAEADINNLVTMVINVLSWVVGIISVIMIIIGGLKYIMSTGDASNINSAKNTILYAIIGLVIVALAQIIVLFVLNQVDQ